MLLSTWKPSAVRCSGSPRHSLRRFAALALAGAALAASTPAGVTAADWTGFRGNGGGVSRDTGTPATWSDKENVVWKVMLPGPGSSSPIILGERVLVTCFSGAEGNGDVSKMKRHLLCFDRKTGKQMWDSTVPSVKEEDPYNGMMRTHGYTSQTPVTDGERVYVFAGKSGVVAFDLDGNELWKTSVGLESSRMQWGSGASPVLVGDLVIVNAGDESESIRALDKKTGKEVWKSEAASLDSVYATPLAVKRPDGGTDLVVTAQGEVWGLNPETGKLRWFAETGLGGSISCSAVANESVVYLMGGRGGGSLALTVGGKSDVTKSHVVWKTSKGTNIPSPLVHDSHLYWVDDQGIVRCADARDGKIIYEKRLEGLTGGGGGGDFGGGGSGGGFGGGGFGGGRGGGGSHFYSSVALADGKLYAVSRSNGTFVMRAGTEFEQLAQNKFESDSSIFNGSPAFSNGQVFLRSDKALYCLGQK